jgi:hypothetical protein
MKIWSAGRPGAFVSIFGLEPGTDKQDLRARNVPPQTIDQVLFDVTEASEVLFDLGFLVRG